VCGAREAKISFLLLENVKKAGRYSFTALDREREAMGLPGAVIGVLTQNYDLDCG